MIDTHAHLNEPRFAEDFLVVRERARDAGVSQLVVVGYDLASSEAALALAERFADGASVGIHPHDAERCTPDALEALHRVADDPRVVAIGETGLDYHYDHSGRTAQHDVFRAHIRLARSLDRPLIMHCRDAYDDLCRILAEEGAGEVGGVAHCFWGTAADAERLIGLGFHLGVGGGITFPKSEDLRQVLREMPLDRLVLETDCPYMAPVPHRGRRNEPAYLPRVAASLGELFSRSPAAIEQATTTNARRCFPRLASR